MESLEDRLDKKFRSMEKQITDEINALRMEVESIRSIVVHEEEISNEESEEIDRILREESIRRLDDVLDELNV